MDTKKKTVQLVVVAESLDDIFLSDLSSGSGESDREKEGRYIRWPTPMYYIYVCVYIL